MKKYYDIEANWWKLRQFYESGNVRDIWYFGMMSFLKIGAEDSGIEINPPKNHYTLRPADFDSCDWRQDYLEDLTFNESLIDIPSHLKTANEVDDFIQNASDQYFERAEAEDIKKRPEYWDWCCMKACHHLVHLNYWVSQRAEPDMDFRIISINHDHSTLYSEKYQLLWDLNFYAFGIPAQNCFDMAMSTTNLIK